MATFDQRPNGKWRAQIRRTGYAAKARTFPTKAAAEKWAREIETQLDKGIEIDVAELRKTRVCEVLQRFLDEEVPQRKGGQWETVRIRLMLREPFAQQRLDQRLPDAINGWVVKRGQEVSAATVNRDLNLLSGIFRIAIRKWRMPLQVNPVHNVLRPRVADVSRGRVWTKSDLQRLRDAASAEQHREGTTYDYVIPAVELALQSAMRLGEIANLQVQHVHLEDRYAFLPETKNGDSRKVPLTSRAVQILQPLVKAAVAAEREELFPVGKDVLGLRFRQLRAKAKLGDLRFHDTRHTAATNASKVLHNVLELAAFTGHRSLKSLQRYYHADAGDLARRLG
jgi:integrase